MTSYPWRPVPVVALLAGLFVPLAGCDPGAQGPAVRPPDPVIPDPGRPPVIVRPDPTRPRPDSLPVLGGVHPETPWNPANEEPVGDHEFFRRPGATTQSSGGNGGARGADDSADADGAVAGEAAAPSAGAPSGNARPTDPGTPQQPRDIEEADVVKVVGNHLFVLNQWRGLQILDVADPDHPVMVARVPMVGRPVEMYVRGGNAYVLVSDYFSWWRYEGEDEDVPYRGSQLAVIDVSDPARPVWQGGFDLDGFISDSRIVGDVLYAVSNRYSWYGFPGWGTGDNTDATVVVSVDIADPRSVHEVERLEFPREGYAHHLNVTDRALLVAAQGWTWGETGPRGHGEDTPIQGAYTTITYVDISDAAGHIRQGESFVVPGMLQDRWAFDLYDGALRIVTAPNNWWGMGGHLRTYRLPEPQFADDGSVTQPVEALARIELPARDAVTAARYAGPRGYVLTYEVPVRMDPLLTVDLSDPENPSIEGELHMPGYIDYAEPRGDRLVTLGRDDDGRQLAVGLYDVSDMARPAQLSRIVFGNRWAQTPGDVDRDDFQKVFKVLDALELVMVPFRGWVEDTGYYYNWRYVGGVQLIDYTRDALTKRGVIDTPASVQRAIPLEERVVTISDTALQVVDVTDRDAPSVTARLDLSRNAARVEFVGDHAVQLVPPDWYNGNGQLVVTTAADPDTASPIGRLTIDGYPGALVSNGRNAFVVETPRQYQAMPRLVAVGVEADGTPREVGSIDLPLTRGEYGYYGWWSFVDYAFERYPHWYSGMARALPVGDDVVLLVATHYGKWPVDGEGQPIECLDCAEGEEPTESDTAGNVVNRWWNQFTVIDVRHPDVMSIASRFTLKHARFPYGMKVRGETLVFSVEREERVQAQRILRSFLYRIDLADLDAPVLLPLVNIPGNLVDVSDGGRYLFTAETDTRGFTPRTTLFASALLDDTAYLRGSVRVDGIAQGAIVRGGVAYLPTGLSRGWFDGATGQQQTVQNAMVLSAVDVRVVADPEPAGELMFVTGQNAGRLVAVEQGRAIFQVGYDQVLVYDISNPEAPAVWDSLQAGGYVQQVVVHGDRAYVTAGPYGVHTVDLAPLAHDVQ